MTVPELARTVCNRDCPDACSIVATVQNGLVTSLGGDRDHPVTQGFLCYRTRHFLARQYSPDRLTTPMLREGDAFRPIDWDAALDLAASKLEQVRRESGPSAVMHYRSGGSLGLLTSLTDRFFQHFGPVTGTHGDICSGAGIAAQTLDFGECDSHDLFDLLRSRSIILWGKNVFVSNPHLIPVLRRARAAGARLLLVDPARHKTASLCDTYVQCAPGADVALAMAVARRLFERGEVSPHARERCENLEAFEALARSRSVSDWCTEADVSPNSADQLADALGRARPSAILVGWGMARRKNGGTIVRALDALGAISGNLGVSGGGVSYYFKRRGAFDTSLTATVHARSIAEPRLGPELLALRDPPVRALWITAGNPVVMLPESHTTARAIASREFVVVVDSTMTDTARLAHLVLPCPTLLESDDLVGSYGHHWLATSRPVVPPPAGVRSDLEIMQGLAARLGLHDVMAGDARAWKQRFLAARLEPRGVTVEQLDRGAVRNPLAPDVLYADGRFPTPSGKARLLTELPGALRTPLASDYPLCLMSLSTERSQSSQWVDEPKAPLPCVVHPDRAAGLANGARARLESRSGALDVIVVHDASQRRDVAIVPKGGSLALGRCANVLVPAQLTDLGDGGALYDEGVRIVEA